MVIAIFNHKGGVGKSATAVNLAAAIARAPGTRTARQQAARPVLLVDLDAQASATLSLGIIPAAPSVADVLLAGVPATDAIRPADDTRPGLDILPASPELAGADLLMNQRAHARERALTEALQPLRARYPVIILDCPPALSLLTVNAIVAADSVIIPTPPEYLALEGLANATRALHEIAGQFGTPARLLGILLTLTDTRARSTREFIERLRQTHGPAVFGSEVPRSVRAAEAPLHGLSVLAYAPRSRPALAYEAFAREVLNRAKKLHT